MTDHQRAYLTRDRIRELPKPKTADVFVDAWDSWVMVKGLSIGMAVELLETAGDDPQAVIKVPGLLSRAIADVVIDPDGNRVFTDADIDFLNDQPIDALMKIFEAAADISGFGDNRDDTRKNSGTGQSAGSSSASPLPSAPPSPTLASA